MAGPRYIINTITRWDEPPRTRHQVARALAVKAETWFVEANEIGRPRIDVRPIEEGLFLVTPYFPLPFRVRYRTPILNEVFQEWLFNALAKLTGNRSLRVVNFDFTATRLFQHFDHVIYYCNDDPLCPLLAREKIFVPYYEFTEKILLEKSAFTVVVSDYLKLVKKGARTHLLYLAVDTRLVDALDQDTPSTREQSVVRLTYLGFVNHRLEVTWLERLADDFPDWRIELIGPVEGSGLDKRLRCKFNIVLHGTQTGQGLNRILATTTVGIIPFKDNPRMRTCSANNKYWQYLLLGKPVVYRYLPYLLNVPEHLMYTAKTYDEFKSQVCNALREDCEAFAKERIAFARCNTWHDRMAEFENLCRRYGI